MCLLSQFQTMKIGLIDLDTSHPRNWVPILRELGHEVVGVYDHGEIHPEGYAQNFAQEHGIATTFDSLDDLVDAVDIGIVHSCNWDTHLSKAKPLIDAGKAVLIDKPLAGCVADLNQLMHWERSGACIAGGSSLRFCQEIQAFRARPVEERGTPQTVFVACGVDEFNYGIHAYSMLLSLMGPDPVRVQYLGGDRQWRVRVDWPDDRVGFVTVGAAEQWLPFAATVITEKTIEQFTANTGDLYRGMLQSVLPYLAGHTQPPPLSMTELVQPEQCAIAALRSRCAHGRLIDLKDMPSDGEGYNGHSFAEHYRQQKYPAEAMLA